ncbi:MAG: PucR family transcriptional regulator [Oleibacter sp.]|nr:PucR family transcriptional regulator [Thalassolituus sp.]
MPIYCSDIPRLPTLESIRLVAGLRGSQHVVRWPYVAENETLTPWLRGGELVFVTGINHSRDENNLLQLILGAVENEAAGMVILTGPDFIRNIPNSVLALANELGFALFEQPYSLPMVQVTEVISNAIVQDNLLGQSTKLFLTRLINGFADAPELVHLRASELGLSDTHPYAVLAIRMKSFERRVHDDNPEEKWQLIRQRNQLEQQLTELLNRRGINWPVLVDQQDLLLIWPTDETNIAALSEEINQALSRIDPQTQDIYTGVSDLQPGLASIAQAAEQARQAARFAVQQHQKLFFYEQLGIAKLFAAIPQRTLLAKFCKEQLGQLCFSQDARDITMKETLTCYLNQFGNQQQAADAMGVHRNTFSHRLKRIEELTGQSLNDPFSRLNLQSALLIEQILFQHHNINILNEDKNATN